MKVSASRQFFVCWTVISEICDPFLCCIYCRILLFCLMGSMHTNHPWSSCHFIMHSYYVWLVISCCLLVGAYGLQYLFECCTCGKGWSLCSVLSTGSCPHLIVLTCPPDITHQGWCTHVEYCLFTMAFRYCGLKDKVLAWLLCSTVCLGTGKSKRARSLSNCRIFQ